MTHLLCFFPLPCLSVDVQFVAEGKHRHSVSFQFLPSFPDFSSSVSCCPLSTFYLICFLLLYCDTQSGRPACVVSSTLPLCLCVNHQLLYIACFARSKSETRIRD
ncbi:hypothetical protein AMECASPLE_003695 [Ameca splendens]|uniref:Secreted protein n=1 Tax=Ameca splendens TaxID=208324 RepID=A0ABV0XYU0_9TELE